MCEVGRWLRACDIILLNSTGKELGMWLLRYSVLAPPPSIWTWLLERGKSVRIHWWWWSHPIRLFSKALLQFFWRSKVKTRANSLQCGSGKKYLVCPLHLKTQIPWKLDAWIDNVLQGHWDLSWVSTLSGAYLSWSVSSASSNTHKTFLSDVAFLTPVLGCWRILWFAVLLGMFRML